MLLSKVTPFSNLGLLHALSCNLLTPNEAVIPIYHFQVTLGNSPFVTKHILRHMLELGLLYQASLDEFWVHAQ